MSFKVIGSSVRGANHIRSGLPNQDAFNWGRDGDNLVFAVADGHGSKRYCRSQKGAKLAVKAAVEVILAEAAVDNFKTETIPLIRERVEEKLPLRIVKDWQQKVESDFKSEPFNQLEKEKLGLVNTSSSSKLVATEQKSFYKAYGTTLLAVLITPKLILYLQLGDGDIVVVTEDKPPRIVFPNEQLGNATNSLSMREPAQYFKVKLEAVAKLNPELVFIASDGYANSFRSDQDFVQAGSDILDLLAKQGPTYIKEQLPNWLAETSQSGSGDDITLAFSYPQQERMVDNESDAKN